jgi:nucleotide-binding universal stress UspA family protein
VPLDGSQLADRATPTACALATRFGVNVHTVTVVASDLERPRVIERSRTPALEVHHLVACVDGTPTSDRGLAVAAAWAHVLGMKLTAAIMAEPCPPPGGAGGRTRRCPRSARGTMAAGLLLLSPSSA